MKTRAHVKFSGPADCHHNLARRAFTLIELLVVIAIIGIMAGIALPKLPGMMKAHASASATRQLLDDVSFARQRAVANRADVYMVFMPAAAAITNMNIASLSTQPPAVSKVMSNLLERQYTGYAMVAARQVGDQPGQVHWRYLTDWKSLPEGAFIPTYKFSVQTDNISPFEVQQFPFPLASSPSNALPFIKFNYRGQLETAAGNNGRDDGTEVIPLARGSIFLDRNNWQADVQENPAQNSRMYIAGLTNTMWTHIRIDGITGKPRVERVEIK